MNTDGHNVYGEYNSCNKSPDPLGRFPANLLVCDDALNDGDIHYGTNEIVMRTTMTKSGIDTALGQGSGWNAHKNKFVVNASYDDTGSNSRYFDLDAWFKARLPEAVQKIYPYLLVPKPSKCEKYRYGENNHPTVKPLKLMSYLITMGSREGDLVLGPFAGSGTTLEAANFLKRRFIGCEIDEKYRDILHARTYMRSFYKRNEKYATPVAGGEKDEIINIGEVNPPLYEE